MQLFSVSSVACLLVPSALALYSETLPLDPDGYFKINFMTDHHYLLTTSIFEYDQSKELDGYLYCIRPYRCSVDTTWNELKHAEVRMTQFSSEPEPVLEYWYDWDGEAQVWQQQYQDRKDHFMAGNLTAFDGVYLLALKTNDMQEFANYNNDGTVSVEFKVPGSEAVQIYDWSWPYFYYEYLEGGPRDDREFQFYVACVNAMTGEYVDLVNHYTDHLMGVFNDQGIEGSYLPTQDIVDMCPF